MARTRKWEECWADEGMGKISIFSILIISLTSLLDVLTVRTFLQLRSLIYNRFLEHFEPILVTSVILSYSPGQRWQCPIHNGFVSSNMNKISMFLILKTEFFNCCFRTKVTKTTKISSPVYFNFKGKIVIRAYCYLCVRVTFLNITWQFL